MQFTVLPMPQPQERSVVVAAAPAPAAPRMRRAPPRLRTIQRPAPALPTATLVIVDTARWGPLLWRALHTAANTLDLDAPAWRRIIHELQMALPCPDCMKHYRTWVSSHPLADDVSAVAMWWEALHNAVNGRLGRATWTREQVAEAFGDRAAGAAAVTGLTGMVGENALALLRAAYGLS